MCSIPNVLPPPDKFTVSFTPKGPRYSIPNIETHAKKTTTTTTRFDKPNSPSEFFSSFSFFQKISLLILNPNTEPTLFENEMKREREKNPFTGIPNSPIVAPMNRQVTHNTTQYSILKYSLSQPLTQVAHTLTHARSTGYTVKKKIKQFNSQDLKLSTKQLSF